jgi:hypothetical protein
MCPRTILHTIHPSTALPYIEPKSPIASARGGNYSSRDPRGLSKLDQRPTHPPLTKVLVRKMRHVLVLVAESLEVSFDAVFGWACEATRS